MQHKSLALDLLKKLLNVEIKTRQKTNIVQSKNYSEMIENEDRKGEDLGLDFRDFAFYSASEVNDSTVAVRLLGISEIIHLFPIFSTIFISLLCSG